MARGVQLSLYATAGLHPQLLCLHKEASSVPVTKAPVQSRGTSQGCSDLCGSHKGSSVGQCGPRMWAVSVTGRRVPISLLRGRWARGRAPALRQAECEVRAPEAMSPLCGSPWNPRQCSLNTRVHSSIFLLASPCDWRMRRSDSLNAGCESVLWLQ